jgi:hypothetical protein
MNPHYMSPAQLKHALELVEYRHPSVNWQLFTHPFEGFNNVCLRITFTVPNSYKQGEAQQQGVNVPVPPIVSRDHFNDWLKWRLQTIANHEVNELFWHRDGEKPILDPHSESYWEIGELL